MGKKKGEKRYVGTVHSSYIKVGYTKTLIHWGNFFSPPGQNPSLCHWKYAQYIETKYIVAIFHPD